MSASRRTKITDRKLSEMAAKAAGELRLRIYQEGRRAYLSGSPCPYGGRDWRAKTWAKGFTDGEAYYNSPIDSEPEPEVECTFQTLKEEIADLRDEIEYLSTKITDLRYDMYSLKDERGNV
jgi:hypothetical protein